MKRKMTGVLAEWRRDPRRTGMVVSGMRQIGKTYTIDEFCRENYRNYLRLDFSTDRGAATLFEDDIDADAVFEKIGLRHPGFRIEEGESVIFLDEIQLCPDARAAIKPLVSDGSVDVIASGSALGVLGLKRASGLPGFWTDGTWENTARNEFVLQGPRESAGDVGRMISESLERGRGRVSPLGYERVVPMNPLDFEEYLWAVGFPEEDTASIRRHIVEGEPFGAGTLAALMAHYRSYMVIGGMPRAVLASMDRHDTGGVRREQSTIMDGYAADVNRYAPEAIRVPVSNCLASVPRNLNKRNKKFRFSSVDGKQNVGWREYADPLSWLDSSGIVTVCSGLTHPERPLESNVGRDFKVYMGDTGLLMSRLQPSDAYALAGGELGINSGGMTENSVANMLRDCGLDLYYFARDSTSDGRTDRIEVDFVVELGTDLAAIEVRSGRNGRSRSLNRLMNDERYSMYDFGRFLRLSPSDIFVDGEGVEHYPLFAAAFLDSLCEMPPMEFPGYSELDLRRPDRVADDSSLTPSPIPSALWQSRSASSGSPWP